LFLPVINEGVQVDGLPIEYYVRQMRRELYVFASRIKSEALTIGGITFESYDDTLKWVYQYCHKDDCKYVMDMPALYSVVKTDGQGHKALLEEQANSTKAGYALDKQARLSLSFQSKIPEFFWAR
jgi:glucose dehydrogenase